MSHFSCTVVVGPDFWDTVYGSSDLTMERFEHEAQERLLPFKEFGWGSSLEPPEEQMKYRVNVLDEARTEKVFDTIEKAKEEGYHLPHDKNPVVREDAPDYEMYKFNPQAKWDWFKIGGRFRGKWKLKPESEMENDTDLYPPVLERVGGPGLEFYSPSTVEKGYTDLAVHQTVDFEGMRAGAYDDSEGWVRRFADAMEPHPTPKTRKQLREEGLDRSEAADAFWEQPAMEAAAEARTDDYPLWDGNNALRIAHLGPDRYLQLLSKSSCLTYSMLYDGSWIAHAEMGWFGVDDDEGDVESWVQWTEKTYDLLTEELPPQSVLINCDLHI